LQNWRTRLRSGDGTGKRAGIALALIVIVLVAWNQRERLPDIPAWGQSGRSEETSSGGNLGSISSSDRQDRAYIVLVQDSEGNPVEGAVLRAASDGSEKAVTNDPEKDEGGRIVVALPVTKGDAVVYHVGIDPPQGSPLNKAVYDIRWDPEEEIWVLASGPLAGLTVVGDVHTITLAGTVRSPGSQMAAGDIADARGSYIRADGIRTTEEGITILLTNGFIASRSDVSCTWETSFTQKGVVEAFRDGVSMGMTNVIDLRPQAGALCVVKDGAKVGKDTPDWFFVEAKCANVAYPPGKGTPPQAPPTSPVKVDVYAHAYHRLYVYCPAPRETVLIDIVVGRGNLMVATGEFNAAWTRAWQLSLPSAIADAEVKKAKILGNAQLLAEKCGGVNPPVSSPPVVVQTPGSYTETRSASYYVNTGNQCSPNGWQASTRMSVTRSATAGDPTSAGTLAQNAANAAAAQLEAEKKASWEANQKEICGTQSQPGWAPSSPIAADNDEDGGTRSNADGDSTVRGSDDPDRGTPDEDDYDDPIQGTNPEPRDDSSSSTSDPPPPAPAPSSKPTNPNGPLR
jgi:hypothetical protein